MSGWGVSWTDNKMLKMEHEKQRQRKIVQDFLANTPDYIQCPENDKKLVDLIEKEFPDSPFNGVLLTYAYKKLKELGDIKVKVPLKPLGTSLNQQPQGYLGMVQPDGGIAYVPTFAEAADQKEVLKALQKELMKNLFKVDEPVTKEYDNPIAQVQTGRRIKDDD